MTRVSVRDMQFVIRASDKVGNLGWVLPKNSRGLHTFGSRGAAQIFTERAEAEQVVQRMSSLFTSLGVQYSIEATDEPDIGA